MRIQSLKTKDGQTINLNKFTVLVGPNNVGKSQTLRDIQAKIVSGKQARTTIIEDIKFQKPSSFEELLRGLEVIPDPTNINQHIVRGINASLSSNDQIQLHLESFKNDYSGSADMSFILGNISRLRTSFLDASSRLSVAQSGPSYNAHLQAPATLLQGLYRVGEELENKLREAFKGTFGMDIKLDYSGLQTLSLRVAKKFENIPEDPRKAFPIMEKHNLLDTQGDGFRSFVGVVLSLLLSEGRIVLLDEPEAFLHPAQAKKLGKWIATHAETVPGQIIISTHNANFLSGILSASKNADIYRLNRNDDLTTYNQIRAEAISRLARSPVLSSQRVLEAIFYKGVVVCEADADRAVYETVAIKEFNNQNILFVHAHNKQTIKDVVKLLKEATIPTAAITDIDILNSKDDLCKLLTAFNEESDYSQIFDYRKQIAESINQRSEDEVLEEIKDKVKEYLQQLENNEHTLSGARGALNRIGSGFSKWSKVKEEGIDVIPKAQQDNTRILLADACNHGLFIVPVGELEKWLDLGTKYKNKWIIVALAALSEGKCSDKLKEFIASILRYMGEDINIESINKEE